MTSHYHYRPDLAALSRRKLQSVVPESGDTLRRCVLIHNIMRSTASASAQHSTPTESHTPPPSPTDLDSPSDSFEDDFEEAYHQKRNTSTISNEQDWLDSILDDLGAGDYSQQQYSQVSVVDADDEEDEMDTEPSTPSTSSSWHPPLFPPTQSSLPTPTSPRFVPIPDYDDDCTFCAIDASPPTSPPGLDADDIDMLSDEDDEEYHYGMMDESSEDLSTPSASTEFPQAITLGVQDFINLPFNRLRPVFCGPAPAW